MFSFFKFKKNKNLSREELLVLDLKNIPQDKKYIDNLKQMLDKKGYSNFQVAYGENINSKGDKSEDICIDIWFYDNKQMYMLTIYSDAIVLLKEVIKQEETDKYDYDYDLIDVAKIETKKGILISLEVA